MEGMPSGADCLLHGIRYRKTADVLCGMEVRFVETLLQNIDSMHVMPKRAIVGVSVASEPLRRQADGVSVPCLTGPYGHQHAISIAGRPQ